MLTQFHLSGLVPLDWEQYQLKEVLREYRKSWLNNNKNNNKNEREKYQTIVLE